MADNFPQPMQNQAAFSEESKLNSFLRVPKNDLLRKREDFTISLRKIKKNEILSQRRAKISSKTKTYVSEQSQQEVSLKYPELLNLNFSPEQRLLCLLQYFDQELNEEMQLHLVRTMRKLIGDDTTSIIEHPNYQSIITDTIPIIRRIFKILADFNKSLDYLNEITNLLLNMFAFSDNTAASFFDSECVILYSITQAIQKCNSQISKIKADQSQKRDSISVEQVNRNEHTLSTLKKLLINMVWIICNVSDQNAEVVERVVVQYKVFHLISTSIKNLSFMHVDLFLMAIGAYIEAFLEQYESEDCKLLWFLVTYTEQEDIAIDYLMDYLPIIDVVFKYLQSDNYDYFVPALRLIGNITSSNKVEYADNFFKNGILSTLTIGWQKHSNIDIQKEIIWLLSNLATSKSEHMQRAIIKNEFLMCQISDILKGQNLILQKEALILLRNLAIASPIELLTKLITPGDIFPIVTLMLDTHKDNQPFLRIILRFFEQIFSKEKQNEQMKIYLYFEQLGGVDFLEELQGHPNKEIYEICSQMIQEYGDGERVQNNFDCNQFNKMGEMAFQI